MFSFSKIIFKIVINIICLKTRRKYRMQFFRRKIYLKKHGIKNCWKNPQCILINFLRNVCFIFLPLRHSRASDSISPVTKTFLSSAMRTTNFTVDFLKNEASRNKNALHISDAFLKEESGTLQIHHLRNDTRVDIEQQHRTVCPKTLIQTFHPLYLNSKLNQPPHSFKNHTKPSINSNKRFKILPPKKTK